MRVYRYVTERKPDLRRADRRRSRAQLAALLGATLERRSQAAIDDRAARQLRPTKRITVVAVPIDDDGADRSGVRAEHDRAGPDDVNGLLPVDTTPGCRSSRVTDAARRRRPGDGAVAP